MVAEIVLADEELTDKENLWLKSYLKHFNKTRASREAGYSGSEFTLCDTGRNISKKARIAAAIKSHLEASAMGVDECLTRLGDMARADIGEFLDENGNLDPKLFKTGNTRLIKKISQRVTTSTLGVHTTTTIELHDSRAALETLAKHFKIYEDTNQILILNEINTSGAALDERLDNIAERFAEQIVDHNTNLR